MKNSYRDWLEAQKYSDNTIQAQLHRAGKVEAEYGDLDEHYAQDRLESVILDLRYSADDKRSQKPNISKIEFNGDTYNNLASYRNATERYCKFRAETDGTDITNARTVVSSTNNLEEIDTEAGQLIGLERDMQAMLRRSIDQLEDGLEIIDDGAEKSVSSGFIDITAQDAEGMMVVIELKTGTARQKAIAQILSYMGDISEESESGVRGILVAGDFDKKTRAAARMVPNLTLVKYVINFQFDRI